MELHITYSSISYMLHKKSEINRLQVTFLMSYTETLDLQTPDNDPLRIEV